MEQSGTNKENIYAYGYRAEERVTYVTRFGGDGRYHEVPVYWDEYIPVTGLGEIKMREDNDFHDNNTIMQTQRLNHIFFGS